MKINITEVSKSFGTHVLFDRLSCTVESGQITCLYGYSGCGKTTLMNMIGFIEPYQGTILYDGKPVVKGYEKRRMLRNRIGFVFQEFGLIENETVEANLRMVRKIRKMKRDELKEACERFGLGDILRKKCYQLSGGEKQRVAMTRLFLKEADLILADEPTGSIDPVNKKIVLDYFTRMKEEGKTILISSHDPQMIEFADQRIDLVELCGK